VRGGFSCILALVIIPLGHWGRLPWGNLDILLNRKGFPIKVTVIGHPLLRQSCIHLPWALGKYRLCDNISMALEGPSFLSSSIFILSATTTSITIGLVLCQRWFLLHEVISSGIMVCVTLIIKTLEYVHLIPFTSNDCLDLTLVHLTMFGGIDRVP
jgi:hypothetical protein